jgi:Zn-dependent protease with chaperone function
MRRARPLLALRRRYGASPLHLAAHLLAFAIAAFALDQIVSDGDAKQLVAWYLGLIVAHDLIFVPAYSGLDRLAQRAAARLPARRLANVPVINHVRAPALISGLLLLIYAPLISGHADAVYVGLSGHPLEHYARNWVLISAALFGASALIYALRVARALAAGRASGPGAR